MKNIIVSTIAAGMLAACASATPDVQFSDGSGNTIHSVACKISKTKCLVEATKVCRGKFGIIDATSFSGGAVIRWGVGTVWYEIIYQCGVDGKPISSIPDATEQANRDLLVLGEQLQQESEITIYNY